LKNATKFDLVSIRKCQLATVAEAGAAMRRRDRLLAADLARRVARGRSSPGAERTDSQHALRQLSRRSRGKV